MLKNESLIENTLKRINSIEDFSGVVHMEKDKETLILTQAGYANRAEKIANKRDTRFGIASGCKLFTAVAICQLVESGMLSFETKITECMDFDFPNFDYNVTVHHLLTHSAGIPDYFDEDIMDDFEELWINKPMYLLKELKDFLPMFQNKNMAFKPGERFHYNNAGFILLGLIVEQRTGVGFTDYIEKNIFRRCGMDASGYFSLDRLPDHTALGYIEEKDGTWRTNTYSIPIKGGADGGAYVTAPEMNKFWDGLFSYKLLDEPTTNMLLSPHIEVKSDVDYGYGIWINKKADDVFKYHVMGYDPGVSFHSAFYPNTKIKLTIPSNKSNGPFKIMKLLEDELLTKG
ncbi:serine hydrolase domain-containing protein [Pseudalkalibacillus sp. R45]|uniref:serine hydrolase domain-containing protein n=1 Tax=Pseudalkalibacillus sp. R45 TaxID=3457433 RepID=UPI003FCE1377